jgi:tetratricopeptide (TPR) repeat protein
MSNDLAKEQAMILLDRAFRHQMKGELADAIILYERSLAIWPTAEAHTYLGWTYSMLDRYDEAIDSCKKAIEIDPSFGNPYNDIGAYLIELKQWEEALPWLNKATTAQRYDSPQFPYLNLGRVHEHLGRYGTALTFYDRALEIDRFYQEAFWGKYRLLGRMN